MTRREARSAVTTRRVRDGLRPSSTSGARTPRSCGTWTARSSTPSRTGCVTEHELAERHGGTWTEQDSLNLVGNDLLESGRYIREHMGIDLEPAEIVEQLLDGVIEQIRVAVPWRPGAVELLADLAAAGVPCALVTMSYRRFVEPILDGLPEGTFAAVVTGDAVERGKPYPDPYLKAARLLGVDPADCLAIEDSNTGARSAETAGCPVLVRAQPRADPGGRAADVRRLAGRADRRKPSGPAPDLPPESLPDRDQPGSHPPWTPSPVRGKLRAVPTPACGRGPDPEGCNEAQQALVSAGGERPRGHARRVRQ